MIKKNWEPPIWRTIKIPCHVIEDVFGRDNFDDCGDELFGVLQSVSDYPEQYRCRFDFDTTHSNPWYHTMNFGIEGITDSACKSFIEKMAALGLTEFDLQ